jgi:hypothetical protein
MRKNPLFILLLMSGHIAFSQDATGEALKAKKTDRLVYVKIGTSTDKEPKSVLVFSTDTREKDHDNFVKDINVAIPEKSQTLLIRAQFKNPLEYKIKTSTTSTTDPSYDAIAKFIEQISLLNTLVAGPKGDQKTETKSVVPGPNPKAIGEASGKDILENNLINAPILAAWKYQLLKGKDFDCISDFDRLVRSIYSVDSSFYTAQKGDNEYITIFTKSFANLQQKKVAPDYFLAFTDFINVISNLEARSGKHKELLKTLSDFNQSLSIASPLPAEKNYCKDLVTYTKGEINNFLVEAGNIQKGREALLKAAKSLIEELNSFNQFIEIGENGVADNAILISRVPIDGSKIQTVNLTYEKQKITVKNNEIIFENIASENIEGTIKVRAYRTILAELSTGVFYTNLRFPKFGVTENNDTLRVSEAGEDKHPFVAATFLNLIPNIFDGDVHPLFQLGVGTGKDLPTFLAGVGVRFVGKLKCSISGGAIWTWRKELTNLHAGDIVKGTADLEQDLQYVFHNKPSLYVGFQVNF